MSLTACTICGAAVMLHATQPDDNALCQGCLPNLADSLDQRGRRGATYVCEDLVQRLLAEHRSELLRTLRN